MGKKKKKKKKTGGLRYKNWSESGYPKKTKVSVEPPAPTLMQKKKTLTYSFHSRCDLFVLDARYYFDLHLQDSTFQGLHL